MDLLLTFLILVSLLSPILSYVAYSDLHASETAFSRQQFSILLQEANLAYADAATLHPPYLPPPTPDLQQLLISPDTHYSDVGYLDPVQFLSLQSNSPDPSSLGLAHLEFSTSPPSISNPNQICVWRLMLVRPPLPSIRAPSAVPLAPALSIPPTAQRVWACGW